MMTDGDKAKEVLSGFLKYWRMETIDADDHSRGILTAWSPYIIFQAKTEYKDALGTELEDPKTKTRFLFLNVDGPFYDKREYWETLSSDGALEHANLITAGDLNLALSAG